VVVALLGPTGVGKTAVGNELASRLGTRVISCDSMQVYRGFPVLTNQPDREEVTGARHELVGCADPTACFSAAQYAALARPLVEEDLDRSGVALLVGGTGLYMRAALAPLATRTADPVLRSRLESRVLREGSDSLHRELARLDPEAAGAIDPRNVRRLIRALESVSSSGTAWSGRDDLWEPAYYHPTIVVGLTAERSELYRRIEARAFQMLEGGAIEEVRRFRAEHPGEEAAPGRPGIGCAIGYPEICRYLDGRRTLDETIEHLAAATRRYARRQLTWLRKVRGAVIIDVQGRDSRSIADEIATLVMSR
jgi:tRNA dimethylallyltransferase